MIVDNRKIDLFALVVVIFLLGVIAYFLYSNKLISNPEVLIGFIRGFGIWSYLAFFLLVILEVVVAPIPGTILYITGGILFGSFLGGTIALIANIAGAAIAFYIGKKIILDEEEIKRKSHLDKMIHKYGAHSIFFLRINPLTSSDVFSFLAGFLRMNFRKFIIATSIALAPLIYIQAYIGEEIFLKNKIIFSILIAVSIIYLIAFVDFILDRKIIKMIKKTVKE